MPKASLRIAPLTSGLLSGMVGAIPVWLFADYDGDLKGWITFLGIAILIWIVRSTQELLAKR